MPGTLGIRQWGLSYAVTPPPPTTATTYSGRKGENTFFSTLSYAVFPVNKHICIGLLLLFRNFNYKFGIWHGVIFYAWKKDKYNKIYWSVAKMF